VHCHHEAVARLPAVVPCRDSPSGDGLILRRWDPAFAEPMLTAIRSSFAELEQWMSWAQEMPTVDQLRQVLVQGQMSFDANEAWDYALFETGAAAEQLVGGAGLHPSDRPERFEIGYWVRTDRTGRGLATAAATALVDAAFTYLDEVTRVAIRMDRANRASAAIPRKLGFALDHEEDRDVVAKGHTGRGLVWIRDRMR
jgi:RimJ/RimL family protein N-acetyltransferase